jgi:hypothetical protein
MHKPLRTLGGWLSALDQLWKEHPRFAMIWAIGFAVAWWVVVIAVAPRRDEGFGYITGVVVTLSAFSVIWRGIREADRAKRRGVGERQ